MVGIVSIQVFFSRPRPLARLAIGGPIPGLVAQVGQAKRQLRFRASRVAIKSTIFILVGVAREERVKVAISIDLVVKRPKPQDLDVEGGAKATFIGDTWVARDPYKADATYKEEKSPLR